MVSGAFVGEIYEVSSFHAAKIRVFLGFAKWKSGCYSIGWHRICLLLQAAERLREKFFNGVRIMRLDDIPFDF